MNSIAKVDTSLLTGTWRLVKIQWHDKKVTRYTDADNWSEITFKPGALFLTSLVYKNSANLSCYTAFSVPENIFLCA